MTNLTRVTGKVFGETASPTGDANIGPYIGQFGSAKAGTYNGTDDVATIQSLTAWSNGFIDAVTPSQQFPTLPEMTGVCKNLSYQECYLLQKGIAEWDSGTTYYTNDFCKLGNTIYYSLQDNNIGHNPSSTTYWTLPFDGQWVNSRLTIATGVNSPTSTNIEYSLSTYLPNDNYTYEVVFSMQGGTAASANSYQYGFLQTDIFSAGTVRLYVARVAQGSSNSVKGAGTATLPVGPGRKVIVLADGTNTGTFNLYAEGYRRVGTNS